MNNIITIKNRPLGHYFLSIFSLILQGEKEIVLKSQGSTNARTIDIANLVSQSIFPNMFQVQVKSLIEEVKINKSI